MEIKAKPIIAGFAGAVAFGATLWVTDSPSMAVMVGKSVNDALSFARPKPVEPLVSQTVTAPDGTPSTVVFNPRWLPDPVKTPGETYPVTKEEICVPGYAGKARNVPESRKKAAYALYEVDRKSDRFEVDHLISLQLGGSNSLKNLWPQSYTQKEFNAFKKDKLENKLHALVCSGEITLEQAQKDIAENWIKPYCKYYNDDSNCKN